MPPSTRRRLVLVVSLVALVAVALPSLAAAQKVELAGKVTASRTVLGQRRVGEPRYLAISDLFYKDKSAFLEVLDLQTQSVIQVKAKKSLFERRFGSVRGGLTIVPQGEIALYRDGVIGLTLEEAVSAAGTRRIWYAELDAANGKLMRSTGLATLRDGEQLQVVGADSDGVAAWFAVTEAGSGGRSVVLRRLDLATLEPRDVQRVALSNHSGATRDHAVRVYASADLAHFAIVEYVEDGVPTSSGQVFFAEPASGAAFAVPAPPTAYGVAFSPDGRYVYLGSAQRGTISRVDVAAHRIDKQVAAPRYLHHLIVSPSGSKLYAFASSNRYTVFDLPDLRAHPEAAHPSGVAAAMAQLHGDGLASIDGAYFVVPEAEDRHSPPSHERVYIVARLVE